jgi:hypothetical protein
MASRKAGSRGERGNNIHSAEPKKGRSFGIYFLTFLAGGVLIATILFLIAGSDSRKLENKFSDVFLSGIPVKIRSLNQLLAINPEELKNLDIVLINLLCAEMLPGAENLNIDEYLAKLAYWADHVRKDMNLRINNFSLIKQIEA